MPVFHNDGLDDPLVLDVQTNFSKGQVSNARANLLDAQQGAVLRNVVLDYAGVLENRRGFRDYGDTSLSTASTSASGSSLQGCYYFDTQDTEIVVVAASGNLYQFDGSDWTLLAAATSHLSTTGNVWFTQVADKLYFSDESGQVLEWDGTEIEPDVNTSATGVRYLVSHGFRVFGATNIDELWVSYILPDAGSDWIEDESGNILADESGNRITGDYKTFFASNATFRVGTGDGDRITALVPWSDFNLLVFKEGSTFAVNTDPTTVTQTEAGTEVSSFAVRCISTRIGCVSHRSAVQVDNDCFFLSGDGVRSVARTIQDGTQGVSPALSYPIDDIIRRINWTHASKACAAFRNGKYILAIPVDGSTTNNMIVVYDRNLNAWYYWDGLSPIEFCTTRFGGETHKLCCLETNGNFLELRDWFGFDASGPGDYRDLLETNTAPSTPTTATLSNGSANTSRLGYWHYLISFTDGASESAAFGPATAYHFAGSTYSTDVSWTPTTGALTANIYRYASTGSTAPDYEDYILAATAAVSASPWTDELSTVAAMAAQASYDGQLPLIDASNASDVKPSWEVLTRAFIFSDPVSPKKPNHVEFEFHHSNAYVDASLLIDGEEQTSKIHSQIRTGAGYVHLPIYLPFYLGAGSVTRKRYNLDNYNPGREIQVKLTEAAGLSTTQTQESEYLRLREINLSAFLETMEDQE